DSDVPVCTGFSRLLLIFGSQPDPYVFGVFYGCVLVSSQNAATASAVWGSRMEKALLHSLGKTARYCRSRKRSSRRKIIPLSVSVRITRPAAFMTLFIPGYR